MSQFIEKESAEEILHPHQEVPTQNRFFWALGGFAGGVISSFFALINLIYITALNYDPKLVNFATSLSSFAAFVTNPLLGHLSDNTRSRWGRRKPWMLAGLMICAVLGVVFWVVPKSDSSWSWGVFIFLAVMLVLFSNIGGSAYGMSLGAMGFEMTTDYNERTTLFKWGSYAGAIAGFVGPWFLTMCLWFEGSQAKVTKGAVGAVYVSIIMAALILVTGLPVILFCREKVTDHMGEKKVPFLDAIKMTLHNKPFWLLVVSNLIMRFAMCVTGFFFPFLFIYHLGHSDHTFGFACRAVMYNSISVASLLATAPIAALTNRIGKKSALLFSLTMSAITYATLWFTFSNAADAYLHIHLPWGAADNALVFQWPCVITGILIGAFTNTMPMIKNSMLADICDYDELKFGHRREAFYSAVFGTSESIAIAVSLAFQGILLVASGFNSQLDVQSAATIRFWLLALVVSQPLGFIVSIISILFYPLTRARMHAIRAEIDARCKDRSALPAT